MNDTNSLSHTPWNCKYHIVFAPKYRRKVIFGQKKRGIGAILRELCNRKNVEIIDFYKMAMDKFVPEFEEFCSLLYESKFPSRFRQIPSLEREMMAVKMGRDPGIKAGFKLSHIMNVGKGYYYEQQKLSLVKKIVNKYFLRGERKDLRVLLCFSKFL